MAGSRPSQNAQIATAGGRRRAHRWPGASRPTSPLCPANRLLSRQTLWETIGWPELEGTVADVAAERPNRNHFVILTANYGETGPIDLYDPTLGLPPTYGGHNVCVLWGPLPSNPDFVIAVGYGLDRAAPSLRGCTIAVGAHQMPDYQ